MLRKLGMPFGLIAMALAFGAFGTSTAKADYYSSTSRHESHSYSYTRTVRHTRSRCRPVEPRDAR